jgi:predicted dienelactone hydrolase
VVVAIDHTDAAAVTVFSEGEARFYNLEGFGIPSDVEPDRAIIDERMFPVWVADQRFVYDVLEAWSVNDPMFGDRLDVTRIGSFGHSFGGATALEVCRVDARCRAAVNMDGGLYGAIMSQPAVRPLLLMSSAESNQFAETVKKWTRMIENAGAEAYWLELPGSTHFSFTITQLLSPILAPKDFDPRAGLGTVDRYLRAFFDVHLRDRDTPPLETTSEGSDVRWLTEARLPLPPR